LKDTLLAVQLLLTWHCSLIPCELYGLEIVIAPLLAGPVIRPSLIGVFT